MCEDSARLLPLSFYTYLWGHWSIIWCSHRMVTYVKLAPELWPCCLQPPAQSVTCRQHLWNGCILAGLKTGVMSSIFTNEETKR